MDRNGHVSGVGMEVDFFLCVCAENDLWLVWGSIDFVIVRFLETDWFLCVGRK